MTGASAYHGDSGQGYRTTAGDVVEVPTTILEGHAQYQARGLDLRALHARAVLEGVAELNAARSLTGSASVGESLTGWYLQGGYDVLRRLGTAQQLLPYVRYERVNTQAEVPAGFTAAGGTATDNCGINATTFALLSQTSSGICPRTVTRTYSIADSCGNTATCTQDFTVDDTTPPVLTCPAGTTV